MLWQVDVHVEAGNRMLFSTGTVSNLYRVADVFDSYLVNCNLAGICALLHICNAGQIVLGFVWYEIVQWVSTRCEDSGNILMI